MQKKRNTDGNPEYAFAFKMSTDSDIAETTVTEVVWNISKNNYLKPTVVFEPLQLGGVTIQNATGFNAKFIIDNNIGPGAVIRVAQNITPYILEVITPADEPQMPDEYQYKWTDTEVDILLVEASDESCIKLIAHFFSSIGVKQVNEGVVGKIYRGGYQTILDILDLGIEQFSELEGFQKRLAEIVHTNIHSGLQNVDIYKVLGACNIFGVGIGIKKIEALTSSIPEIFNYKDAALRKKFSKTRYDSIYEKVLQVPGFSDKTATKIVSNLHYANQFLYELKNYATYRDEVVSRKPKNTNSFINGKKVVFSGCRPDTELEEKIKELQEYFNIKGKKLIEATELLNQQPKIIQDPSHKNIMLEGICHFQYNNQQIIII
jgi:NAD-dependent DNA ligase